MESKKWHVIRCVKLGMTALDAMYAAGCTADEMEILESDEKFNQQVRIWQKWEEANLLEQHNRAMEIAADKGSATAIQWKLERINAERWSLGGGRDNEDDGYSSVSITVPDNGRYRRDKKGGRW